MQTATILHVPVTMKKRKAKSRPKPQPKPNKELALTVAAIGTFVLLLSVWECCSALQALTGMPIVLAALLAIGIDVGMVVSEAAAVVSSESSETRLWAERYVGLAVVMSVVLNAAAAASHAEGWMKLVAMMVGGMIPILVYVAGRVAGGLWAGR